MTETAIHENDKVCLGCGEAKPDGEFFIDKRRKYGPTRGLFHRCKTCTSKSVKGRRSEDPDRFRAWERKSSAKNFDANAESKRWRSLAWRLKYRFRISMERYLSMFDAQNGRCAICTRPINKTAEGKGDHTSACIDHDHASGLIRGLLCHYCNTAIGLLGDNPVVVDNAAKYLERFKNEQQTGRYREPSA